MNIYNLILFFVTLKCMKRKASSHYLTVLHRFTLDTQSNSINRHRKKIITANCKSEHVHVCTTTKFNILKGLKFLEIKLENFIKFCLAVYVEMRQTDTKNSYNPHPSTCCVGYKMWNHPTQFMCSNVYDN